MSTIQINGTDFLTGDRVFLRFTSTQGGIIDVGNLAVYNPAGPNAGDNDAGLTTTQWTDTLIEIDVNAVAAGVDGAFLRDVLLEDLGQTYQVPFDVSPDIAVPPSLTYPLLEGICSPAPDTIRFEGQRFLTATAGQVAYVITRLLDYTAGPELSGGSMQYELADGSPDASGWTLVSHTDNVIEISNPAFTTAEPSGGPGDFVVQGVAFHDITLAAMYFYEPWGDPSPYSAPVDGAGCV